METCDAYDPIFDVHCTAQIGLSEHTIHLNEGENISVTWVENDELAQTKEIVTP